MNLCLHICTIEIFGWMFLQITYQDDLQIQVSCCLATFCLYECVYKIKQKVVKQQLLDLQIILACNL